VLNVYEDDEVITILFANEIDKIDKRFKFNLKKLFNLLSKFNYKAFETKVTKF